MNRLIRLLLASACAFLALAVGLGALGAHLLEETLGEHGLALWVTASTYHFYHGLGVLGLLAMYRWAHHAWLLRGIFFLITGTFFFSGSLYLLAGFPGWRWLGPVTPVGGMFLLAGWLLAGYAMLKR